MAKGRKSVAEKGTKTAVKRGDDSASKFGPKKASNSDSSVSDGAGTRERAGLPTETKALMPPKFELPAAAKKMASSTMPVPGVNDGLINVHEPWDFVRDQGLGRNKRGNVAGKG